MIRIRYSLSDLNLLISGLVISGGAGKAVGLDAEVIAAHLHVEEAVVAPVGTPRVAANPVLLASLGVLTVADDRDFVVNHREEDLLGVDVVTLTLVDANVSGLPVAGSVDTARDGTVHGELGLHLLLTLEGVVLTDVVLLVLDSGATVHTVITLSGGRPGAVTADINICALAALEVVGDVLLARRVRNTVLLCISIDEGGVATIARAASLAVDDNLGVEADRGGGEVAIEDVESIGDGRGGALSPA